MSLLEVDDIEVRYGAIRALKGVSFHVEEGEVVALLGANGAGKTTTQKTVSGMMRPALGEIRYDGERIDGLPAHDLIHLGICHVPEGRRVFPRMTVAENLEMGAFRFKRPDQERARPRASSCSRGSRSATSQYAGTLSGGEQQMLAIARALMGKPRLLLLDEPSMGLAPLIVRADLRHRPGDQLHGRHRADRRAERRAGARAWPTAATCSRPARSCSPAPARSCSPTTASARPTSARRSPPELASLR